MVTKPTIIQGCFGQQWEDIFNLQYNYLSTYISSCCGQQIKKNKYEGYETGIGSNSDPWFFFSLFQITSKASIYFFSLLCSLFFFPSSFSEGDCRRLPRATTATKEGQIGSERERYRREKERHTDWYGEGTQAFNSSERKRCLRALYPFQHCNSRYASTTLK